MVVGIRVVVCAEKVILFDADVTIADAEVVVSSSGHVQYPNSEAVRCK